ncbi:tripartite tricarboxylate transporter substrate-binding protein [Cellulomonas sp. NPDC055163]
MRSTTRVRTRLALASAVLTLATVLTACSPGTSGPEADQRGAAEPAPVAETTPAGERLSVHVPTERGTGWDVTGQALVDSLAAGGGVNGVDIVHYRGADGTVGLTQLVGEADPGSLLVVGDTLVGAIELTDAAATLDDVRTLARLTDEPLALVVTADSPYRTATDLLDDILANGPAVPVTGGPAGGADHLLAIRMLLAAGVPAAEVTTRLHYVPQPSTGESFDPLFDGTVRVAVADVSEHADLLASGSLRALAVSGAARSPVLPDVPTLGEQGVDVVLTSWRGVAAAGTLEPARLDELGGLLTSLHGTPEWQAALEQHGWSDAFLTGPELDAFVAAEVAAVRQTLVDVGLAS